MICVLKSFYVVIHLLGKNLRKVLFIYLSWVLGKRHFYEIKCGSNQGCP